MSKLLLESITSVGAAADGLAMVCARHGALIDSIANDNPFVTALRRQFSISSMTPNDMLSTLGKLK